MRTMHWMTRSMILALMAALTLGLYGCGGDDEADGHGDGAAQQTDFPDAATPKDAAIQMVEGVQEKNKAKFIDAWTGTDAQKETAGLLYEFAAAMVEMQEKVKKEYGEEAAKEFAQGGGPDFMPGDDSWKEKITVKEDGDTATIGMEGEGEDMKAVKTDEGWKLDLASMTEGEEMEQMKALMPQMTAAIKEVSAKVGEDGMTVEKLKQEMGQRMMAVMFAAMAQQAAQQQPNGEANGPVPLPVPEGSATPLPRPNGAPAPAPGPQD